MSEPTLEERRKALEAETGGRTWTTDELRAEFTVRGFCMGVVVVDRLRDGKTGSLEFEGYPRLYYGWVEDR